MKHYTQFIPLLGAKVDPLAYGVHPLSINSIDGGYVFMADEEGKTLIIAVGGDFPFEGKKFESNGSSCIAAPLTHHNAVALRQLFPFTAPRRILNKDRTIGVGDRLGIATFGHARVFQKYDAFPVLAQLSAREMRLTGRSFSEALDSATFAVYREGHRKHFGADANNLKTAQEVELALQSGFTMISLDQSSAIKVGSATDTQRSFDSYLNKEFTISAEWTLTYEEDELQILASQYSEAIDYASDIWIQYVNTEEYSADFELAFSDAPLITTAKAHFYIANELKEKGVHLGALAPKFSGEFEKGIDYIGDRWAFEKELEEHTQIATYFGHKISLHNASYKFSILPAFGRITAGRFHIKTSGTSWLEAMRVVASADAQLFRQIHAFALEKFSEATKDYKVSTTIDSISSIVEVEDADLVKLFADDHQRQLLHITYGAILTAKDGQGKPLFKDELYSVWQTYAKEYSDLLYKHIGRHLNELYKQMKG